MLMMVVIILMFFNLLKSCYWSIFLHYVQIIVGVWVVTLLELLVAIRCIG